MWVKAKVGKLGRELHRAPISLWGTLDATTLNNPTKPNTHSILGLINSILYINFPLKVVDMIYRATQSSPSRTLMNAQSELSRKQYNDAVKIFKSCQIN